MRRFLGIITVILFLGSCNNIDKRSIGGEALGTTYEITYYSVDDYKLKRPLDSIFERVNQSMSTYRETSDISQLNEGDTTVKVDTLFLKVFAWSQEVHEKSGGYFDPTVGNLVNLYGFGPEKGILEADSARVDSLLQFVGLEKVKISKEGTITKQRPGIYLDFNAIAKGYTIDLIGHYLNSLGIENYLIELGGELLAQGMNINKDATWIIGIDDPNQGVERTTTAAVQLIDRGMATSGNYRKNRIDPETGQLFVHTINPLTGFAEKSDVLSATVLAENCALADAWATAFMAMGYERSVRVLKDVDELDVFLIYAGEDGGIKEFTTQGFEELMIDL